MASKVKAEVIAINRGAVNAVASAIAKGIASVNATGSLLTQCVKVAREQYKGKAIPDGDVNAILDTLAESQGWTTAARAVRQSEYKAVLTAYTQLPEAMKEFGERAGKCTWHDGIALARLVRGSKKHKPLAPKAAAIAHGKRGKATSKPAGDLSRGDAKAEVARFVKRAVKMSKLEKDFRDALAELCGQYSIEL